MSEFIQCPGCSASVLVRIDREGRKWTAHHVSDGYGGRVLCDGSGRRLRDDA